MFIVVPQLKQNTESKAFIFVRHRSNISRSYESLKCNSQTFEKCLCAMTCLDSRNGTCSEVVNQDTNLSDAAWWWVTASWSAVPQLWHKHKNVSTCKQYNIITCAVREVSLLYNRHLTYELVCQHSTFLRTSKQISIATLHVGDSEAFSCYTAVACKVQLYRVALTG